MFNYFDKFVEVKSLCTFSKAMEGMTQKNEYFY